MGMDNHFRLTSGNQGLFRPSLRQPPLRSSPTVHVETRVKPESACSCQHDALARLRKVVRRAPSCSVDLGLRGKLRANVNFVQVHLTFETFIRHHHHALADLCIRTNGRRVTTHAWLSSLHLDLAASSRCFMASMPGWIKRGCEGLLRSNSVMSFAGSTLDNQAARH